MQCGLEGEAADKTAGNLGSIPATGTWGDLGQITSHPVPQFPHL